MGLKIPYMATDFDTPVNDNSVCLGMVSRRTLEKIDQSPPWNRIGNIRLGDIPIFGGLVGSPQGEEQKEVLHAIEGYGRSSKASSALVVTYRSSSTIGLVARSPF